jgi:hypothetical protein
MNALSVGLPPLGGAPLACRATGPGDVERNTALIGPQIEIPGDELGPLVNTDSLRVTDASACAIQGRNDILTPVAEPRINHWREPREGVDHRQTSATGVPSSAWRKMNAICASENFDFFMELSFSHHRDHNWKIPAQNGPI